MPLKGLGRVRKAMEMIKAGANDDVRGVWFAGMQNIVEGTPARSGGTRNAWRLSEGRPKSGYADSNGIAPKADSKVGGSKSFASIFGALPDNVLGKKLFFSNDSPAIHLLEYGGYPNPVKLGSLFEGRFQKLSSGGYSKQAPGGWVRKDLILMRQKIRSLR